MKESTKKAIELVEKYNPDITKENVDYIILQ